MGQHLQFYDMQQRTSNHVIPYILRHGVLGLIEGSISIPMPRWFSCWAKGSPPRPTSFPFRTKPPRLCWILRSSTKGSMDNSGDLSCASLFLLHIAKTRESWGGFAQNGKNIYHFPKWQILSRDGKIPTTSQGNGASRGRKRGISTVHSNLIDTLGYCAATSDFVAEL